MKTTPTCREHKHGDRCGGTITSSNSTPHHQKNQFNQTKSSYTRHCSALLPDAIQTVQTLPLLRPSQLILPFFLSFTASTPPPVTTPRLSVSAHLLLCFFLSSCLLSPSSTSVQPPLSLLSHGGRRTRARATQVSGEQFGVQFSVSNSRLAAHLD